MRLHEYEASAIFDKVGIAVPKGRVASTPDEVKEIADDIGGAVVLKAQVLVGGRGLAGGVKIVQSPGDARSVSEGLFGTEIKGLPVKKILVTEKIQIQKELYFGITVDGYAGKPVVMVSSEGGVSIEKTAQRFPDKIASHHIDICHGLLPYEARTLFKQLKFPSKLMISGANSLVRLYWAFKRFNALIAEINPIAVVSGGKLIALDAVLEIDDSAYFRMKNRLTDGLDHIESPLERRGKEIGVTYVDLDGDIGIIASGAGLGMATMDIIGQRLKPANFLETGGGITEELMYNTMELMMMKEGLRAVFINVYGGINPIHEGAKGVVRYMKDNNVTIPVVAKALGNHQEDTWEIFRKGGVQVVTDVATEKGVERLLEILGA